MIEDRVRELVAGMAAVETRTLAEQVDYVAELERSAAIVLAELAVRVGGVRGGAWAEGSGSWSVG